VIVSHVIGGLGNQMFQYAAARALSLSCGLELKLDTSGFERYEVHSGFELNRVFSLDTELIGSAELQAVFGWRSLSIFRRLIGYVDLGRLIGGGFVAEPSFKFWPGFFQRDTPSYLIGYWQSYKYFSDYGGVIRADFSFGEKLNENNSAVLSSIKSSNSVSLHVRRGDYVSSSKANSHHGVCGVDYYARAVAYISSRVSNPVFYVFSDDIEWSKKNLVFSDRVFFIDWNVGSESYIDMQLMTQCKHNVIANSSFSWWGGWLNGNRDKIVVAPNNWFVSEILNTEDLIPDEWVCL